MIQTISGRMVEPDKRAAIDDPDLQPLWDRMSGTLWKRAE